jgi:hypothetical protein
MATGTKNGFLSFDEAYAQVDQLNEQVFTTARKAGNLCVDSYERAVFHGIAFEVEAAGLTDQEWLKSLVEAQAKFARGMIAACASTARMLLE